MPDVKVMHYRGHHPEKTPCTYKGAGTAKTFVDAKQLAIWNSPQCRLEREGLASYAVWSPYSGILERLGSEHPELKGVRSADGRLVRLAGGTTPADGNDDQLDAFYILLVEDSWNKLAPERDEELEEPLVDLPDLSEVDRVRIIVPHELVADGNANLNSDLPDCGIGICDLVPENEALSRAQREGRISFEEVVLPSAFDNLQMRRRADGLLRGAGVEPDRPDVMTEKVMLELLRNTLTLLIDECERDGRAKPDLRILRELRYCGIDANGRGFGNPKSIDRDTVRTSKRFDFCIVDKATSQLLLAIEVDGELHRHDDATRRKDREKDAAIVKLGGLVVRGNNRATCIGGGYSANCDAFKQTSFTCLRLPTDGTTCYELNGNEDYVSIGTFIRDRMDNAREDGALAKVPYRTVRDLNWGLIDPQNSNCSARSCNKALSRWKLISKDSQGWQPTPEGRDLGITLSLYGQGQKSHCIYLPWAERVIAEYLAAKGRLSASQQKRAADPPGFAGA